MRLFGKYHDVLYTILDGVRMVLDLAYAPRRHNRNRLITEAELIGEPPAEDEFSRELAGMLDLPFAYPGRLWKPSDQQAISPWNMGWAMVTGAGPKDDGSEFPIVFLSINDFVVIDIDGKPGGGAPRGVLATAKTDGGVQYIYRGTTHRSTRQDPWYEAIARWRGGWGMRVRSWRTKAPRLLMPGPEVRARGWVRQYTELARLWSEAGGTVDFQFAAYERGHGRG